MWTLAVWTRAHVFEQSPPLPKQRKKKIKYFDTNVEERGLNK